MDDNTNDRPRGRVAVLLYGYARAFDQTSASLLRHLVDPLNADVFFYGPTQTDAPGANHKGQVDHFGRVIRDLKQDAELSKTAVNQDEFRAAYRSHLKRAAFRDSDAAAFREMSNQLSAEEWLFKIDPARFFGMAHNMAGVFSEMETYEREIEHKYDWVILTRPDLTFYSPITWDQRRAGLHIPLGEGFNSSGEHHRKNCRVFFYKNAQTGELIQTGATFNDQILILPRREAGLLERLPERLFEYARMRVPLNAESLLYFHFCVRHQLELITNEWFYEIRRFHTPQILNVTDTYLLTRYDPSNPKARRRISANRIRYYLRGFVQIFLDKFVRPTIKLAKVTFTTD